MATVLFEEQVEVPLGIQTLEDFRRWALSNEVPEREERQRHRRGHWVYRRQTR